MTMGMDSLPFVSLVVVNYNGEELLPGFFSALEKLNYPQNRREVIFIDDCSTDDSILLARRLCPQAKIIRNRRKTGPAQAKNIGIKNAQGEFIATLDNDVRVSADWLAELSKVMRSDELAGIAASKLLFEGEKCIINSAGGIMNRLGDGWDRGVFLQDRGQFSKEERVFYGCSAAMLIRRRALAKTGFFDGDYFYLYEDLDLGWRMNLAGFKVIYAPAAVAIHKFSRTMGRDGYRIKYLLEKNRCLTILKNYSFKSLIKILPEFFRIRPGRLAVGSKGSDFMFLRLLAAGIMAWVWNIIHLPATLKKRFNVQHLVRVVDDAQILGIIAKL